MVLETDEKVIQLIQLITQCDQESDGGSEIHYNCRKYTQSEDSVNSSYATCKTLREFGEAFYRDFILPGFRLRALTALKELLIVRVPERNRQDLLKFRHQHHEDSDTKLVHLLTQRQRLLSIFLMLYSYVGHTAAANPFIFFIDLALFNAFG